jgi:hypothetical protein
MTAVKAKDTDCLPFQMGNQLILSIKKSWLYVCHLISFHKPNRHRRPDLKFKSHEGYFGFLIVGIHYHKTRGITSVK